MYGAEAGNLALKVLARGGIWVAGGIAVKIRKKMEDGTFFRAFCEKEKFARAVGANSDSHGIERRGAADRRDVPGNSRGRNPFRLRISGGLHAARGFDLDDDGILDAQEEIAWILQSPLHIGNLDVSRYLQIPAVLPSLRWEASRHDPVRAGETGLTLPLWNRPPLRLSPVICAGVKTISGNLALSRISRCIFLSRPLFPLSPLVASTTIEPLILPLEGSKRIVLLLRANFP